MFRIRNELLWRDTLLCTILTYIVSGLFLLLFINLSVLDPFYKAFKDFSFTDIYYSKKFYKDSRVSDIILVNVQQQDRYTIAQTIDKVALQNPKVIGLDMVFKDRKQHFIDSILKTTLAKHNNIVTSYYSEADSIIRNDAYFISDFDIEGYINVNLSNQDAVIRDFVGVDPNKENAYSFATQVALTSGEFSIENASHYQERIPINYIGNKETFLSFDMDEILASETIPAMNDAIVLFGYLGTPTGNEFDIEDRHFTPLNPKFAGRSTPDMFGVVIHANIVNMLTQANFITKVPKSFIYIFAFIISFFAIMYGIKLYKRSNLAYDILIKLVQLTLSIMLLYLALLLLKQNIYVFITPILVLTLFGLEMINFYAYLIDYLKKRFEWKSYLLE